MSPPRPELGVLSPWLPRPGKLSLRKLGASQPVCLTNPARREPLGTSTPGQEGALLVFFGLSGSQPAYPVPGDLECWPAGLSETYTAPKSQNGGEIQRVPSCLLKDSSALQISTPSLPRDGCQQRARVEKRTLAFSGFPEQPTNRSDPPGRAVTQCS